MNYFYAFLVTVVPAAHAKFSELVSLHAKLSCATVAISLTHAYPFAVLTKYNIRASANTITVTRRVD